jgi:SAM-dependent methyltransferase
VLDVGCGEGHAAAFFKTLGCDVMGVDGSMQAARDSIIPDHHVIHDFVNGPYLPAREFDLVWSCEFVEHVEEKYCQNFLATFACSRQYILTTHAGPGQPGWHHVNLQEEDYWIEKVEGIGFQFDPVLTDQSRQIAEPGHYEDRGLVFTRND